MVLLFSLYLWQTLINSLYLFLQLPMLMKDKQVSLYLYTYFIMNEQAMKEGKNTNQP